MGIKMIDFGAVEVKSGGGNFGTLKASDRNGWLAEPTEFKFSIAKSGTRQVEVTFKVTDPDAVNTDGNPYTGRVWDRFFFTEKSAKMTKLKLRGLGYPVDDLVVGGDEDIQDLAEELTDNYVGLEVRLQTEIEDEDTDRPRARVRFINQVS